MVINDQNLIQKLPDCDNVLFFYETHYSSLLDSAGFYLDVACQTGNFLYLFVNYIYVCSNRYLEFCNIAEKFYSII